MALVTFSIYHLLLIPFIFIVLNLTYQFLFSPIRHIPGPLPARITNIYRALITRTGIADQHYRQWHKTYGPAVRVGPNAVSISDPSLIKVIYGFKDAWVKVFLPCFVLSHY